MTSKSSAAAWGPIVGLRELRARDVAVVVSTSELRRSLPFHSLHQQRQSPEGHPDWSRASRGRVAGFGSATRSTFAGALSLSTLHHQEE